MTVLRGRLLHPSHSPDRGERVEPLASVRNLRVEQILSGTVEPVDYRQEQDEWAVVLEGGARLEVDGEVHDLERGDWILLPAGTRHRLVSTERGTSWLTVHLDPAPGQAGDRGRP